MVEGPFEAHLDKKGNMGLTLQVWNDEDPDDEVLAMVVRTGCNSTIGNMLRRAMRPSHFLSATDSLVKASRALSFAPTPGLHIWCIALKGCTSGLVR